jgi:hypothetical protein
MLECPRCHRPNPNDAAFCHFDGAELRERSGRENGQRDARLPHEFVFPSGRCCRTYDELIQGCQAEWEVARDLLGQGIFQQFLATGGRLDLAQAAQQAKGHPDPDIALDTFLARLPARVERSSHLDLSLRRLNLGTMHVGETRQIELAILNEGKGLLHGTLTVADGVSWLRLGPGKGSGQCLIKTAQQQDVTVRVDTHGLAAPHPYSAKLTVITNGGVVEVPVGLDLEVQPFAQPPFEGIRSPREMAEQMRTHPKPAVPLLENGDIARWFEVNGWTYPVSEPTAEGVAAVQQFFEGMGLSKPPVVQLSAGEVSQSCLPGEVVQGQLALRTSARKWVYARVESDAPWLRPAARNVSGPQQAGITFEAHSQNLQPGRVHEGNLKITANAGQALRVPVRLEVRRLVPSKGEQVAHPLVVGAATGLIVRLLLALPTDLCARLWVVSPVPSGRFATFAGTVESPELMSQFVRNFVLLTSCVGAVAAATLLWRRGHRWTDLVPGLIAGAVAGLVGGATFACLLPGLDWLPYLLGHQLAALAARSDTVNLAWLWILLWIALAAVSWAIWGAVAGWLLAHAGQPGVWLLRRAAQALAWLKKYVPVSRRVVASREADLKPPGPHGSASLR